MQIGEANSRPWRYCDPSHKEKFMFWAIFVALLVLWAVGLICHVAFSNLLLVIAVIVLIIRLIRGRAPGK
jgi:hypothetical protein